MRVLEVVNPDFLQMAAAFVSTPEIVPAISREVKAGRLRKLGSRLYTRNLKEEPEQIVQRNLWLGGGGFSSRPLIADRTALDYRPASDGLVFLIANHNRPIKMPGRF